jgi:hypothetical protein
MCEFLCSSRSTLIFGNGIGMAISPSTFGLVDIVKSSMKEPRYSMPEDKRTLIRLCMKKDMEKTRETFSENHLETVQRFMSYCEEMMAVGHDKGWLNEDGRNFRSYVHEFVFNVAKYLTIRCTKQAEAYKAFSSNDDPFVLFIKNLCEYVKVTKSHVATVNYDAILYNNFLETGILKGYSGFLIDGFLSSGFAAKNLNRKDVKALGYYLHLHGSPLYYNKEDVVYKYTRSQLEDAMFGGIEDASHGRHIVLTHSDYKMPIIQSSQVLREYWKLLEVCFEESDNIVLIGCSGNDWHLNDLIRSRSVGKRIWVVEWEGAGDEEIRKCFWAKCLCVHDKLLEYRPLPSIFNFDFGVEQTIS